MTTEPRVVALPATHPLATRHDLDIEDLLDEPFLALPAEGRALRDYRLATDSRNGHPLLIAAEIANAEETARHSRAGLGVCPLSAGNAPLIARNGVAIRPIIGVTPSRLALVWRRQDQGPLLAHLRTAVRAAASAGSTGKFLETS